MINFYERQDIPAFGIKQRTMLCHKYEGDSMQDGKEELEWLCNAFIKQRSPAIYTLCLYRKWEGDEITDKTPCSLSNNFRLVDHGEMGAPGGGDLLTEVRALREEVRQLREEGVENKLGVIGEIMEMEAVQPLLMAVGTKIADWITGQGRVGELKRVSGIPGVPAAGMTSDWRTDPVTVDALERLSKCVPDLPEVLKKLADMAETKPGKFKNYLSLFKTFG